MDICFEQENQRLRYASGSFIDEADIVEGICWLIKLIMGYQVTCNVEDVDYSSETDYDEHLLDFSNYVNFPQLLNLLSFLF